MALFDKLNAFAKDLGEKTTDAIEITKLNSRVSSEQNAANASLQKIGAYYYERFAAGEPTDPELAELFADAAQHYAAAQEAQEQIQAMKAPAAAPAPAPAPAPEPAEPAAACCPACGAENAPGTRFCGSCGAKLDAPGPKVCPACGAQIEPGVRFCGSCGGKVD